MRTFTKLIAGAALSATAIALSVVPAIADPPKTPKASNVVGVGSDTIQNVLNQFAVSYNAAHKTGPRLVQLGRHRPEDRRDRPAGPAQGRGQVQDRPAERLFGRYHCPDHRERDHQRAPVHGLRPVVA